MTSTSAKKTDCWQDDQLVYRIGTVFRKAPTYPMPLWEYMSWLDSLNLEVPFSFSSLFIVKDKLSVIKELVLPKKDSSLWPILDHAEPEETVLMADPLLGGRLSLFFCHSVVGEEKMSSLCARWFSRWGTGKQGMLVSESPNRRGRYSIAVPGTWFAQKSK